MNLKNDAPSQCAALGRRPPGPTLRPALIPSRNRLHDQLRFTEEFDFSAMNEKFNKDEVSGTLGKSIRSSSKEKGENATDEDEPEEENDSNLPKVDVKADFFYSLSSNALDRQSNYGQTRFSEQMKLDTETFGEFSRYRGGRRGGRVPYHGGGSRGGRIWVFGEGYSWREKSISKCDQ
ncbi:LSM domain, FDF domain, FFD box, DFDF domain, TFG box [Artemisia annua]|uniref:LSM domain, FDF domain, FFD box, DFDF domain, TFG box n=1 Tax=Artemisia annua TaxID=35608 RepID=A0A2U1KKF6_ARTAN|nr:LSM domain, FDF domain, FFD box, DFDF domain, TFG box [Artemisia annua]